MSDREWLEWEPAKGGFSPWWRMAFRIERRKAKCIACSRTGENGGEAPLNWQLMCLAGNHTGPRRAKLRGQ